MAQHDDKDVRASIRQHEKEIKTEEQIVSGVIIELLGRRDGRAFMNWLLEQTGVNNQPYAKDPNETAFKCGELNVGQKIVGRIITESPQGYITLLQERNSNGGRIYGDTDDGNSDGDGDGEIDRSLDKSAGEVDYSGNTE